MYLVQLGSGIITHMLEKSVSPNKFSFPPVIPACSFDSAVEEAKQVHAHVIKLGFVHDLYCQNNLIHMYVNFDSLEEVKKVCDNLDKKDDVSWTTLISGYSRLGCVDEAFSYVSSLYRVWCTGASEWIYEHIRSNRIVIDHKLAITIIDMYCKCGCLDKAYEVFDELPSKGVSSWNYMIGGYAMNGEGKDAIKLLKKMEAAKTVTLDYVTFVNFLGACAHSGLVEEGKYYFSYMTKVYNIAPGMEHYGIYGNIDMAEEIGKQVIELEPNNNGRYVLLANLYAKAGRYEDVAYIRKLMNERGVEKVVGFSIIELEGTVNEFIAGGRAHLQAKEKYAKVEEMLVRIKDRGYVPDTDGILYDICEEENDNPLQYHSEKLAISLGLLKTKRGETIHVTKILRV
ncbi:hypothetical protein DH2020_023689 [Rehmannia glutinosa]|uniref:DYW domain-containing protein n=1 Tax=Rehmannia glutinosa TaxID=99300 RepID=A0ABR0W9M9_REHGL